MSSKPPPDTIENVIRLLTTFNNLDTTTRINIHEYLTWFDYIPYRPSLSRNSPQETSHIHGKNPSSQIITLAALAKQMRTGRSTTSHQEVMAALSQTLTQKSFYYSRKSLSCVIKQLKAIYKGDQINDLLKVYFIENQGVNDYWRRRRFIIATLLYAGANPNAKGDDNLTILGEAVLSDDIQAAALLLNHGSNPNVAMSNDFEAPIIWYANSEPMRTLLLKHKAYVPLIPHTSSSDAAQLQHLLQLAAAHT